MSGDCLLKCVLLAGVFVLARTMTTDSGDEILRNIEMEIAELEKFLTASDTPIGLAAIPNDTTHKNNSLKNDQTLNESLDLSKDFTTDCSVHTHATVDHSLSKHSEPHGLVLNRSKKSIPTVSTGKESNFNSSIGNVSTSRESNFNSSIANVSSIENPFTGSVLNQSTFMTSTSKDSILSGSYSGSIPNDFIKNTTQDTVSHKWLNESSPIEKEVDIVDRDDEILNSIQREVEDLELSILESEKSIDFVSNRSIPLDSLLGIISNLNGSQANNSDLFHSTRTDNQAHNDPTKSKSKHSDPFDSTRTENQTNNSAKSKEDKVTPPLERISFLPEWIIGAISPYS